ncbi:MAG: transcriptional regulator, partial [Candidatus Dormiibacterota bacterium]
AGTNWFATLDGLYRLAVDAAAEAPLLLEIDDIQWCDRPSLRFLAYLVHRLEGLPALVAVGLRVAESGSDATLLGEIAHDAATASIYPAPLSEVASAALFRTRLGADPDSRFVAASHRATGGNPLLLGELLRVMEAEKVPPDAAHVDAVRDIGPRAVSRTVLLRLSRLPVEAVAVARATAVLGEDASLPAISGLAELSEARVAEAGRALVRAEILRPEPPHGYLHPLVRDAVYHELAPVERELRHAQAARLLLGMGVEVEQVAAHLLRAPCRGESWVVAVLRDASLRAMQKGAAESAVSYLRRALAESPPAAERPELLLALGMAEALVHAPSSAEHLKAALDTLPDPASRAGAAQALARMLIFTRPPEEAVAVVKQAAAELPAELLDQRRALEAMELYAVDFGAPEERTASRLARVRDGMEGDGPGARMLKAVAAWDWALTGGPAPACVELALTALADGVLVAADPAFMSIVAIGVLVLADRDEADVAWESALAEAHRRGSLDALAGVHIWRGWTWLQRGELGEAERSLRQAIEETTLWNSQQGAAMPYAQGLLARVLVERGELAGARDALARRGSPIPTSDGDGLCRRS